MQTQSIEANVLGAGLRATGPMGRSRTAARVFAKDVEIFAEGDSARYFYRVVSGAVRTYKTLNDGRRQIYAFHLAGDFFGLESGDEHRFTAEAVDEAAVSAFRRCSLDALSAQDPDLSRIVVNSMLQSLERAHSHMLLLGRKCAVERVASFLLGLAARLSKAGDVDLPMSRTDIADHLGLTIETVSRSLTQLERDGVIALPAHRRMIQLKNRPALAHLDS